ncbi:unnamed protein product [Cuscuta campestris]|uniref:Secreted protein n=1 Tax=Cuscuta campestris TaxID=132261 RepID=A0A484KMP0_9ASTE|nr:unnamed protein product [Cuscuta campestris]
MLSFCFFFICSRTASTAETGPAGAFPLSDASFELVSTYFFTSISSPAKSRTSETSIFPLLKGAATEITSLAAKRAAATNFFASSLVSNCIVLVGYFSVAFWTEDDAFFGAKPSTVI